MELNEFIESTLFEIGVGVAKAKVRCGDFISIAPGNLNGVVLDQQTDVHFDVEITTSSGSEKSIKTNLKGGAGFKIFVADAKVDVGGDIDKAKSDRETNSHRVSFTVPVRMNAHHRDDPHRESEAKFIRNYDFSTTF